MAGYRATGLYPWNPSAVHLERLTVHKAEQTPVSPPFSVGNTRPTVTVEAGPFTSGCIIGYRYDPMNNIVITHVFSGPCTGTFETSVDESSQLLCGVSKT